MEERGERESLLDKGWGCRVESQASEANPWDVEWGDMIEQEVNQVLIEGFPIWSIEDGVEVESDLVSSILAKFSGLDSLKDGGGFEFFIF